MFTKYGTIGVVTSLLGFSSVGAEVVQTQPVTFEPRFPVVELHDRQPEPAESSQELQTQPTPFSVWIDLKAREDETSSWPIWLESIEFHDHLTPDQNGIQRTVRIRFRNFSKLHSKLLARLHYVDIPGAEPTIAAWSETAVQSFKVGPLGQGLGLATADSFIISTQGVDYIDIDVNGNGANLLGVFLASLGAPAAPAPIDFPPATESFDPFGASASGRISSSDSVLYGRVKAPLLDETVKLSDEDGRSVAVEFDLEEVPLLAMVTFEVLNLDLARLPFVLCNARRVGTAEVALPDLADPAYRGVARALQPDLEFHYSNWVRCNLLIPASLLQAGTNRLEVVTYSDTEGIAVRAVELQLKYNSTMFDYELQPLNYKR